MANNGQLSGLSYDPKKIVETYSNDSPNNKRSDGGFYIIDVQVNEPDYTTNKSVGWVTLWHSKTVRPRPGDGSDRDTLPMPTTGPIFVGELKIFVENESFAAKPPSPDAHRIDPPFSKICVPHIMLQHKYQGLRLAPALWHPIAGLARANVMIQINAWNRARVGREKVNPEPPVDVIAVFMPDQTLRDFWDKVGFNFLASQHQTAWEFGTETKAQMLQVFDGVAVEDVTRTVNEYITIAPGEIRGRTDYIENLAVDGLIRGDWSRVI